MKKILYSVAIVLSAAIMLSCGSKSHYVQNVTKGNKSTLDSLSYALGTNVGFGFPYQMPDMKLNWETVAEVGEANMLKDAALLTDPEHEAALETLQTFFAEKRNPRMSAYAESLVAADSTKQVTMDDFIDYDVFENEEERATISEAFGCDIGANMRMMRMPIQTYWFKQGLIESANGESRITQQDMQRILNSYYTDIMPMRNVEESEKWLAKVEKMSGVKKTESGLLYRIDREGDDSLKPGPTDVVKVDYEGHLRDGVVFDSSYERGEPIEFPLQNVIKGWTEGLQLVGQGAQITLWIPADLAYGVRGSGSIGPNEALEFKVEVHEVKFMPDTIAAPAEEASAE